MVARLGNDMIGEIGDHPAAASYDWLVEMKKVIERRPENFNRVMQASEKKLLEEYVDSVNAHGTSCASDTATRPHAAKRGIPDKIS